MFVVTRAPRSARCYENSLVGLPTSTCFLTMIVTALFVVFPRNSCFSLISIFLVTVTKAIFLCVYYCNVLLILVECMRFVLQFWPEYILIGGNP